MLRRLSSRWTFFNKRIFPKIWLVFAALFLIALFFRAKLAWPVLLPLWISMLLFSRTRKFSNLADEVWETEDALVVKNKNADQKILFSDIQHVSCLDTMITNPSKITLTLDAPGRLGEKIAFSPLARFGIFPGFSARSMATELMDKVARARPS